MTLLITGCCGHIGSYLLSNLCRYILGVDNFLTQRYPSIMNLPKTTTFYPIDFIDTPYEVIKAASAIIHLAAITDAANSGSNREIIQSINIDKTKDFLKRAMDMGKFIIFPSSTSVYGTSEEIVTEESPVNPQSFYAEAKLEIERFLQESFSDHIILRFGTIFGTSIGMRFHTAINKFCFQAAYDQPLTIWKENYEFKRPYLGLQDMKQAINLALATLPRNQIYNVLTDNFELKRIIELIRKYKDVDVEFIDTPLLNQFSYEISCDKIKQYGFSPKNNLQLAIKDTLNILGVW